MTDGASVYNGVIRHGATPAACMAHAYRCLEDAKDSEPDLSHYPMGIIKGLFDIERVAAQLTPEERLSLKQKLARPRLETLKSWFDEQTQMLDFLPKASSEKLTTTALTAGKRFAVTWTTQIFHSTIIIRRMA